ncbi:hypothetical protein [Streptomyces sp. Mo3]|uniref:hypothetical protein n=1 Tax=Streptomyces sp. Mo3 TaxID=3161190 RepID=UPI0039EF7266
MTGLTAEVFGVPDRGRLAPGLVADLVAFDRATVGDTATYADPRRTPTRDVRRPATYADPRRTPTRGARRPVSAG